MIVERKTQETLWLSQELWQTKLKTAFFEDLGSTSHDLCCNAILHFRFQENELG